MVPWVPILWSYEGLPSITARRLRHTLPSALLMQCEIPFNFHPWWAVAATPVLVGVFFWWPAGDICCPTPVLRRLVRHCQRRRPSFPPRSMSTTPHTGLFQYVHNNWPKTGVRTHQICLRHSWVEFLAWPERTGCLSTRPHVPYHLRFPMSCRCWSPQLHPCLSSAYLTTILEVPLHARHRKIMPVSICPRP